MLTTRSVIIAIISVAILSVVCGLISLLWSGATYSTLGKDFYGTRAEGYRALHDLLVALEFETERVLITAPPQDSSSTSYVLWNPRDSVVQNEPAYLKGLLRWVQDGGYLVVTPSVETGEEENSICPRCHSLHCRCIPIKLLKELGLEDVTIEEYEILLVTPDEQLDTVDSSDDSENTNTDAIRDTVRDIFQAKERPTTRYSVACEGEWDNLSTQVEQVELPSGPSWRINLGELEPLARIAIDDKKGDADSTLAALFSLGKGRVAVISNPYLASNASLSSVDNSVLLAHLLTGSRSQVVFDEFYHGLTVRGNPIWLLSKRPYAVVAASILAVVGVWVWRQAIFLGPSRLEQTASRRTLSEYIEAMSRFLLKGRESSKFVLSEVRDGVLWHFCKTLGLPPQQQNVDVVLGLLARRTPQKASQLDAALRFADAVLDNPRAPKQEILLATQKVSDCLST